MLLLYSYENVAFKVDNLCEVIALAIQKSMKNPKQLCAVCDSLKVRTHCMYDLKVVFGFGSPVASDTCFILYVDPAFDWFRTWSASFG